MKDLITKLLLKLGFGNKIIRGLAASIAAALLVVAPDLDVNQATEVFFQILSGLVLYVSGKAAPQLGETQEKK